MALTCFKGGTECAKKMKTRIYAAPAVKGFNVAILTINPVTSGYIENQIGKKKFVLPAHSMITKNSLHAPETTKKIINFYSC